MRNYQKNFELMTKKYQDKFLIKSKKNIWPQTYITLQHFSQDYDLASNVTFIVCVNFIHEWRVTTIFNYSPIKYFLSFHFDRDF